MQVDLMQLTAAIQYMLDNDGRVKRMDGPGWKIYWAGTILRVDIGGEE